MRVAGESIEAPPRAAGEYAVVVSARGLTVAFVGVVLAIAVVGVVHRAGPVFALLGGAATAAVIAAPIVRGLDRWMPRAMALVLVTLAGIAGTVATLALVAWDLDRQARSLTAALHDAIERLDPAGGAARLVEDLDLSNRIDRIFDGAAARLVVGDTRPLTIASLLGKTVVVAVLAAFLVAGGRHLFDTAVRFVRRASIREQLHTTSSVAIDRAGSYLRRTIAVGAVHGAIAAGFAHVIGLPGAITLGAWVAVTSTVPVLGGPLAWAPIVALSALGHRPLALTVAVAIAMVVADRLARARWVHAALRVGPVLALAGIGVGHALIGISGSLVGLLVVALFAAYVDEPRDLGDAIVDLVEDPADRMTPDAVDVGTTVDEQGSEDGDDLPDDVPGDFEPVLAEARADQRLLRLAPTGRTTATIVAIVVTMAVLTTVLGSVRSLVVWFTIGAFIAVGVDRPVSAMHARWRVPRVAGTTLVLGALVGAAVAVVMLAGPSITNSAATVTADAPETVASMESLPIVGRLLEQHGASDRVEEWLATLPDRLRESDAASRIARAAGDGLLGAGWTIAMALAILWDGPRLVRAVQRRIAVQRRQRAIRFGRAAYTAFSNVVAAAVFVATLNGTVVMLLAVFLGIPMAPVLGMWAAAWNLIPQVGGFVGALPLVALGLGQSPWTGVIALVAFVTYQTFENHVLQPLIGSRVVHVPPLVVLVGALFGGAMFGFVGALMAGPTLGVAKVAMNEFADRDQPRIEDRVHHGAVTLPVGGTP